MSERFNVILDTPPEERWRSIVQKTDFKQVLKFFRLYALTDEEMPIEKKAEATARIFFDFPPEGVEHLFEHILDFIACGEKREEESGAVRKVFDYNVDHGRIFAAFLQAYGIDLRKTEMHWWTFCELLNALPEDTKLSQYIEIRGRKPGKNDSPEYKKELRRMQESIKIEDNGGNESAIDKALDAW